MGRGKRVVALVHEFSKVNFPTGGNAKDYLNRKGFHAILLPRCCGSPVQVHGYIYGLACSVTLMFWPNLMCLPKLRQELSFQIPNVTYVDIMSLC